MDLAHLTVRALLYAYRATLMVFSPLECVECGSHNTILCERCKTRLLTYPCTVLHRPTKHIQTFVACAPYRDRLIQNVIARLKYDGVAGLAQPTALVMALRAKKMLDIAKVSVVAVPLHKRRLARRGFNQSELLADAIAAHLMLPRDNNLVRRRYTQSQSKLTHETRQENVRGAFEFCGAKAPRRILLVDDIATTLATLDATAAALIKKGTKSVVAIAFARG